MPLALLLLRAGKRRTYGNVAPHVVLPFVLDDSGGLGKEAWKFVLECRDKAEGQVAQRDFEKLNWSCQAFTRGGAPGCLALCLVNMHGPCLVPGVCAWCSIAG